MSGHHMDFPGWEQHRGLCRIDSDAHMHTALPTMYRSRRVFWGVGTQAETVADDDTQDWLANVMSNTVAARRPSLGGPAGAQGGGGPPVAAGGPPRSPRQRAADRVARKTLIIKSGAADAVEHEASGAPLCMRAPVHACSLCALRRPKCSRQGKASWTTNRGGTAQERCVVHHMLFIPVRSEVQKHRSLPPHLCAFTRTKSVQCMQYAHVFIPSEVGWCSLGLRGRGAPDLAA